MSQLAGRCLHFVDLRCSSKGEQERLPKEEEDLPWSVNIHGRILRLTLVCGSSFASSHLSLAVIVTK
jgi:hypothetical protein